ncbi:hypothetical protein U9M48_043767 [Paspalum notatum var. saurae]|uniref:Dolichol-phosphate mannosyltransferase subunit 3 n=1 Tax=Paspalum notatum var. saurae TaxID=547442 RepID=A0AAQ3XHN3_PASNO
MPTDHWCRVEPGKLSQECVSGILHRRCFRCGHRFLPSTVAAAAATPCRSGRARPRVVIGPAAAFLVLKVVFPNSQRVNQVARKTPHYQMKHIFKIVAILVAISSIWIALLETSSVPRSYTWLLPIYLVVALGCYGLFMVGFGLMFFPTCPQEAILLQQDIVEAKEFLAKKGVDVASE